MLVRAAAKVNTGLRVLGRRPDGMHEILAPTCLVGLFDDLWLQDAPDGQVRLDCNLAELATADNLACRAARALQARAGGDGPRPKGARIRLRKRIPSGAGLGGGSADAAAALRGLNRLWGLGLDTADLCEIGLEIGADVPFFVRGESGVMLGLGERLLPSPPICPWMLLAHPPLACETAAMYRALQAPAWDGAAADLGAAPGTRDNDFLDAALALHPQLRDGWKQLQAMDVGDWQLTGTGSSFYLPLQAPGPGRALLAHLPHGWKASLVPTLSQWPRADTR